MRTYEFDAVIQKHPEMDSAFIDFPYDVAAEFGVRGQVKVQARFDGHPYRGILARMGGPCHLIGLNKDVRRAIGKNPGDSVHVVIEQDLEERKIEPPPDFGIALAAAKQAGSFFSSLSYSHQREYVRWIEEAKRAETRKSRIEKAVELLNSGAKRP